MRKHFSFSAIKADYQENRLSAVPNSPDNREFTVFTTVALF